jgi:hypothetical protein
LGRKSRLGGFYDGAVRGCGLVLLMMRGLGFGAVIGSLFIKGGGVLIVSLYLAIALLNTIVFLKESRIVISLSFTWKERSDLIFSDSLILCRIGFYKEVMRFTKKKL